MSTAQNYAESQRRRARPEAMADRPAVRYSLDDYTRAPETIRVRHRAAYVDGARETFTPELRTHLAIVTAAEATARRERAAAEWPEDLFALPSVRTPHL